MYRVCRVPGQEVDQSKLAREIVEKDCQVLGLNREDAMDRTIVSG